MTQEQLHCWAAGIMDDGAHIRTVNRIRKPDYPRLHIAMTHKATVERMQAIFRKGEIKPQHKRDKKGNDAWRWECNGDDARHVLEVVYPFLFTNQRKAEIVLALSDFNITLSQDQKSLLRQELQGLNSRYTFNEN